MQEEVKELRILKTQLFSIMKILEEIQVCNWETVQALTRLIELKEKSLGISPGSLKETIMKEPLIKKT